MSSSIPWSVPTTAAHVLVCTGPACARMGSEALFAQVWDGFEAERLAYYSRGGRVRMTESGCLGACEQGPTVAVYVRRADGALDDEWHLAMDLAAVMALGRRLNAGP